jgi:predicted transcriptional regulator
VIGRRIPHIENRVADYRYDVTHRFIAFVHNHRLAGKTYREIAEGLGIHPSTVRRYVKQGECYGSEDELAPRSNAVPLVCCVCEEPFTASRADRRFCSNSCRQDAYRHRKAGRLAVNEEARG